MGRVSVSVSVHSFEIPNPTLSDRVLVAKIVSAIVVFLVGYEGYES